MRVLAATCVLTVGRTLQGVAEGVALDSVTGHKVTEFISGSGGFLGGKIQKCCCVL